ncbi:RICIN domain-containing protein [Kitasatospora sp. NPDC002040]|uniref:RICIN domain-containing protein n=1 Tax=Kitasatospora sp. NPDC002040 TaxID=3154661 RepID=UPI003333398C
MLVDWPAGPFVLHLHRSRGRVASAAADSPPGTPVLVGRETGGAGEQWVAERFRAVHVRIRHAATGLYLTVEGTDAGAAVVLRPEFPDTGGGSSYWRQAWRAFVQRDTGRLLAINDQAGRLLGLAGPVGGPLVLEDTVGAEDRSCTAWVPVAVAPPQPGTAPAPGAAGLAVGTGRVRVAAHRFEKYGRIIEDIFGETVFREVPGPALAPGTLIEAFDFDGHSQGGWFEADQEGGLLTYTDDYEHPGSARKVFHRLPGEPARYVDADEVDVHYVPPAGVDRAASLPFSSTGSAPTTAP